MQITNTDIPNPTVGLATAPLFLMHVPCATWLTFLVVAGVAIGAGGGGDALLLYTYTGERIAGVAVGI